MFITYTYQRRKCAFPEYHKHNVKKRAFKHWTRTHSFVHTIDVQSMRSLLIQVVYIVLTSHNFLSSLRWLIWYLFESKATA